MELKNKTCVITGAAGGLGAEIARELTARGALVLLSDIDGSGIEKMAEELGQTSAHCNVTDREQVIALGRAAIDKFGSIDLWINNAGVWSPYVSALETDFNRAHLLVEVNYFGLAYGMLEAIKHMQPRGEGTILNILSVRALKGKALGATYSASKFAAEGFTQAVRDEFADSDIQIIGAYPYRIKTNLFGEHKHEDYDQSMEPKEVAKIIVDNLAATSPSQHLEIWSPTDVRAQ